MVVFECLSMNRMGIRMGYEDMTKQLFWDWSANINTVHVRYVGKLLVWVSGLFICAMVVPLKVTGNPTMSSSQC